MEIWRTISSHLGGKIVILDSFKVDLKNFSPKHSLFNRITITKVSKLFLLKVILIFGDVFQAK